MAIQPSDTGQLDTSVYAEGAHGSIGVSESQAPAESPRRSPSRAAALQKKEAPTRVHPAYSADPRCSFHRSSDSIAVRPPAAAIDNSAPLRVRLFAGRFAPCFFLTSYTWAKSLSGPHDQGGLVGNGSFIGSPQDYYNLENEHSLSGFDLRHRFVQTVLCELPAVGTGAFARHLTGGWKFATIITAQAGFPAGIANGRDTTGTGQGSRADAVAGQTANLSGDQRTWQRWFNTDAFTLAE